MFERGIYSGLIQHLQKKQITVITGMRRVGKTTAVKHLLEKIPHNNKVFIDLEKIEYRHIFNQSSYQEIQIELEILGIDFTKPSVIALDEIQLMKDITSVIKYFYDTFDIKFVVTGSSSFYLRGRFSESLAGRKRIFEMYPLNFAEYLEFKNKDASLIRKYAFQSFQSGLYLKFKSEYEDYLRYGGFPEVVLAETDDDKKSYLKDIINAYIELDIKLLSDLEASHDLYKLIRLLAGRIGSQIDYSKIGGIIGINRNKVKNYFELLERTYFIIALPAFTKNVDQEIRRRTKFYLADTGLASQLARISSGQLFENAIACQLKPLGPLHYYQRKNGLEIDFILDEEIALEVKETPTAQDLNTLGQRAASIGIEKNYLIGRYPPGSDFKQFVWGGSVI